MHAETTPDTQDLNVALAELRARRRTAAWEAEQGDPAAAQTYKALGRELAAVEERLRRREDADRQRLALEQAEAVRQREAHRAARRVRIAELTAQDAAALAAVERGWTTFVTQLEAFIAHRRQLYDAVCAVRELDGEPVRGSDRTLLPTRGLSWWLRWRLTKLGLLDRPEGHFGDGALAEALALPTIPQEEAAS